MKTLFGEVVKHPAKIDQEAVELALTKAFAKVQTDEDLAALFVSPASEVYQYILLQSDQAACSNTSLLFNPHRFSVSYVDARGKNLLTAIKDPKYIKGLARLLIARAAQKRPNLFFAFQHRINKISLVKDFPPIIARRFAKRFGVSQESCVLDPCGGWGGRMLGISSICDYYTCFEPSTKTYQGLKRLARWIQDIRPTFQATVHHLPFEEATLPKSTFDFAITSPPYYDTELYSDESTNSCNRYSTWDAWVDGFYLPMICKTMDALKPGKVFLLNIGTKRYRMDYPLKRLATTYRIKQVSRNPGLMGENEDRNSEVFYTIQKI